MNKYIKISIFLIAMIFLGSFSVYAKVDKQDLISQLEYSLPEQAGIYDIPGRPDLKLRVYVYHDKSVKFGKPSPVEETCGLSDPDSSSETPLADWKLPATWIYRLNTVSVPSTVGANNLSTIAQNAVKEWSNAIDNKVLISRGSNTTTNRAVMDGQNIIAWGRAPSGALAVSYIWYRADGIAVEIDTIMNNKYVWYWSNPRFCKPAIASALSGPDICGMISSPVLLSNSGLNPRRRISPNERRGVGVGVGPIIPSGFSPRGAGAKASLRPLTL